MTRMNVEEGLDTASASPDSFWAASCPPTRSYPALTGKHEADVAIVGAGFTGLWTAYHLKKLSPDLDVVIVEAEHAGFGASGRNGGWVIGGIAGLGRHIGDLPAERRRACCDLLGRNVDDIGNILAAEGIEADFRKGGSIAAAARYPEQIEIQKRHLQELYHLGFSEDACYWLDADALTAQVRFNQNYGGVFFRDYAVIHPGKLVHGLTETVERQGVRIYENSPAQSIEAHTVSTGAGQIEAETVVVATEGYSHGSDMARHIMPVQSLIIATEPLSPSLWDEIGLADRPSFSDASRLVNYGQRTADGRIVFGARGNYRYGGLPMRESGITRADIRMRHELLADFFPPLKDVSVTYGWGGSVGLSRNFRPHALIDRQRGIATAGGYAGEGVAASHLMSRTLAELILSVESERTAMPWAWADTLLEKTLKRWEPEPMRWLTARTINFCYDQEENLMIRKKKAPLRRAALSRLNDFFSSVLE